MPKKVVDALAKKGGKKKKEKDPNAPKKPLSAFMHFSTLNRALIIQEKPELKFTGIAKESGHRWREVLTPEDKARYQKLAEEDKARYAKEMETYVPPAIVVEAEVVVAA